MEENYKSDYRLIDPREEEIKRTTANFYKPALEECGFKLPLYALIYNQIRYYEDFGKLKIGYSIQSKESFAEQFGVSVKQVEKAFDHLTNRHKLGNWIICDTKIFRNVTKIWVSNVRQKRGTMDEAIRLLQSMSSQNELPSLGSIPPELPSLGSKTPQLGEQNSPAWGVATPELTEAESNNKIKENKMSISGSDEPSTTLSPFSFLVSKEDKPAGAPDGAPAHPVINLKEVPGGKENHVDGKVVSQLLAAGGKKDVVTAPLVSLVRKQAKKYGGVDNLFEMVKRVKFEPFYAKMGMMSLLADKNLSNIMNMDNEVHEPVKKDWHYYYKLDKFDPERIKFFKEHPEYML